MPMGWSHGGGLARRLAHAHPGVTTDLAQMCSLGFENWGNRTCIGPACLLSNFTSEVGCISLGIFRGEAGRIFDAGTGISKGMFGDTFRSCGSCFSGNFHCLKPIRGYYDLQDATYILEDSDFPVPHLEHIVVLFGRYDSVCEWRNAGLCNPDKLTEEEIEAFGMRYFPGAVAAGAKLTVKVMPGNHLSPSVYAEEYVETVLKGTGQLAE